MFLDWWDLPVVWCLGATHGPVVRLSPLRMHSLPRDPEFVFYDQLKQVMNAYR